MLGPAVTSFSPLLPIRLSGEGVSPVNICEYDILCVLWSVYDGGWGGGGRVWGIGGSPSRGFILRRFEVFNLLTESHIRRESSMSQFANERAARGPGRFAILLLPGFRRPKGHTSRLPGLHTFLAEAASLAQRWVFHVDRLRENWSAPSLWRDPSHWAQGTVIWVAPSLNILGSSHTAWLNSAEYNCRKLPRVFKAARAP